MSSTAGKAKKVSVRRGVAAVGVRELRQSASQLLDQVKEGRSVVITEHGVPVAQLIPITESIYEQYLASGRIIPARNPKRVFTMPKGKIAQGKQLSEILIEERKNSRF
jgi:prevent-host-death family protein